MEVRMASCVLASLIAQGNSQAASKPAPSADPAVRVAA
jgi:hypothetical protein